MAVLSVSSVHSHGRFRRRHSSQRWQGVRPCVQRTKRRRAAGWGSRSHDQKNHRGRPKRRTWCEAVTRCWPYRPKKAQPPNRRRRQLRQAGRGGIENAHYRQAAPPLPGLRIPDARRNARPPCAPFLTCCWRDRGPRQRLSDQTAIIVRYRLMMPVIIGIRSRTQVQGIGPPAMLLARPLSVLRPVGGGHCTCRE